MKKLLQKIFPKQIDNTYKGMMIAYYVFVIITSLTIFRSLVHILATDGGAQSIAGFPLNSYSKGATSLIVLAFSLWGASQLLMGLLYVAVIVRYKSLISLMYVLIVIEYATRLFLGFYKPVLSTHTVPGGIADYVMIPVALIMLALSLRYKKEKTSDSKVKNK